MGRNVEWMKRKTGRRGRGRLEEEVNSRETDAADRTYAA